MSFQLSQGTLVRVSPSLVKRRKTHFHNLPCGASIILGNNGLVWISPTVNEDTDNMGGFIENHEVRHTHRQHGGLHWESRGTSHTHRQHWGFIVNHEVRRTNRQHGGLHWESRGTSHAQTTRDLHWESRGTSPTQTTRGASLRITRYVAHTDNTGGFIENHEVRRTNRQNGGLHWESRGTSHAQTTRDLHWESRGASPTQTTRGASLRITRYVAHTDNTGGFIENHEVRRTNRQNGGLHWESRGT